ncbi:MAG: right-handed parallel beta-helix repeat-containing protein [Calditrichaeota bacterium]|nr:right-handed parallel beta-helix repeat-containing protein [Calditrichota bacterium]MCB9369817.1 right-handed parallel beta-helix repeat-containing protein [Calditrichota bacterium]
MKKLILVLVVAGLVSSATATIRTVSQFGTADYTSVSSAVSASSTGDTILVSPGSYNDAITITFRTITIIGAGWDATQISPSSGAALTLSTSSNGSVLEGMAIVANTTVLNTGGNTDSVTIRRCTMQTPQNFGYSLTNCRRIYFEDCVLTSTANSTMFNVSVQTNSTLTLRGCILGFNGTSASSSVYFSGNNGSPVEITNCTFVNCRQIFNLSGAQPVVAINNVLYDWTGGVSWGSYLAGSVFDYNASDATGPAIPGDFTNHVSLGANDPFVNYDESLNYQHGVSDLHLNGGTGGLLLTDAGNPLIFDVDASQSDVGAYGGPKPLVDNGVPSYPFVISLDVPNLLESGDDLNVSSTGRVGPRY